MKFELKPDNRNSSDENLINDLFNTAKRLGKKTITRSEYDKHGRYSEGTLRKRFGGWLNALEKARLSPTKDYYVTDEQLIDELKRISKLSDVKVLSKDMFNKYKKISNTATIERHFGSWSKALKKAGLILSRLQISRYSNEELFENLLKDWTYHGRQPTVTEMSEPLSNITPNTYSNRFGTWRKALESFVEYINSDLDQNQKREAAGLEEKNSSSIQEKEIVHKHTTKRNPSERLKVQVLMRDGNKCRLCGITVTGKNIHFDHIKPWDDGGETVLENLQVLCAPHNLGKGNLKM